VREANQLREKDTGGQAYATPTSRQVHLFTASSIIFAFVIATASNDTGNTSSSLQEIVAVVETITRMT
jgi:hypothetical protein